jgi:hypothetical protein
MGRYQSDEDAREYCSWCLSRMCRGECGRRPIGEPSSFMDNPTKLKCQRGSCKMWAMPGDDLCRQHRMDRDTRPKW